MTTKQLGRIERATFGYGGYQDSMIGLSVTLSGEGWGVQTGWFYWPPTPDREHESAWVNCQLDATRNIWRILKDSKRGTVDNLKGCPIEATFESEVLKSWRILTEVIP